ncbi:MAG: C2H2-type zinc finger protein [Halalkalicoccus sp.]
MVGDPRDDDATEEGDEFRCTICDETFEDQQSLERHGEDEHEGGGEYSKQP